MVYDLCWYLILLISTWSTCSIWRWSLIRLSRYPSSLCIKIDTFLVDILNLKSFFNLGHMSRWSLLVHKLHGSGLRVVSVSNMTSVNVLLARITLANNALIKVLVWFIWSDWLRHYILLLRYILSNHRALLSSNTTRLQLHLWLDCWSWTLPDMVTDLIIRISLLLIL